jgi:preprotein translocase subunit SecE
MASASIVNRVTTAPQAVVRYVKESYAELRKVSWPSRETTIRYTVIVAASSIAVGAVIGGIDFLLALLLERVVL